MSLPCRQPGLAQRIWRTPTLPGSASSICAHGVDDAAPGCRTGQVRLGVWHRFPLLSSRSPPIPNLQRSGCKAWPPGLQRRREQADGPLDIHPPAALTPANTLARRSPFDPEGVPLGVIELKVLECGRTSLDYELALSGHPDRITKQGRPTRNVGLLSHPIYTYIIEHTEGRVLVDTAVSGRYQEEWKDRFYQDAMAYDPGSDGLFSQRLEQIGMKPTDFEHVIITHLHTDHAGNVRLFDPANTRIYVGEDELRECVRVKGGLLRDDLLTVWGVTSPQGFTRNDFASLLPDRVAQVYADFELLPDVWIVTLPGHTWGTLGVAVRLKESGWVLIASDTVYLADSWGKRFVPSLLHHNLEQWARSSHKVRRLMDRYKMTVLPGHDDKVIEPTDGSGGFRISPLLPFYQ